MFESMKNLFEGELTKPRYNKWQGMGPRYKTLAAIHKKINSSKYTPHQGPRECHRRRLGGAGKG